MFVGGVTASVSSAHLEAELSKVAKVIFATKLYGKDGRDTLAAKVTTATVEDRDALFKADGVSLCGMRLRIRPWVSRSRNCLLYTSPSPRDA